MSSCAVHGTEAKPSVGVTITTDPTGATISPTSGLPGFGTFLYPVPNPVNSPTQATGIKIDAHYNLTNLTNVTLYSGDNPVGLKNAPIPSVFTLDNQASGQPDDGWCLSITVQFLSGGSSILVKSVAVLF